MSDEAQTEKRVTFARGTAFTPSFDGERVRPQKSFRRIQQHVLNLLITDQFEKAGVYLKANLIRRERDFFTSEEGETVFR